MEILLERAPSTSRAFLAFWKTTLEQLKNCSNVVFLRLKSGGPNFSHFRRQGLVNERDAFEDFVRNPMLAQLGFVNLKRWKQTLTKYKLGILEHWNIFQPYVYIDSPLAVEIWLRTCLPQLSKAYSGLKGT